MAAHLRTAGRKSKKRVMATAALAVSLGGLLLATEIPHGFAPGGGGTAALAELLARSPGARIGGTALKAKEPRFGLSPVGSGTNPGSDTSPENALASVLGTSAGPEGPIPNTGPTGPGGFPSDFTSPGLPGAIGAGPGSSSGPDFDIGSGSSPSVGGSPFLVGGGGGSGGGGGGGGGGGIGTNPGGGGGVIPGPGGTIPGVPEPSSWLLLIAGFGIVGHAMRHRRRVVFA